MAQLSCLCGVLLILLALAGIAFIVDPQEGDYVVEAVIFCLIFSLLIPAHYCERVRKEELLLLGLSDYIAPHEIDDDYLDQYN